MFVPSMISCETQKGQRIVEQPAMLDCGARGRFIDQNYAKSLGLETQELEEPILVKNVDGTFNKKGTIKRYVDLDITIHGRKKRTRFHLTGLGKQKIILGLPWLRENNPDIDWKRGTFTWRNDPTDQRL